MPKRSDIKKIMVIGSGPIIIGQAAEFDYAGTQACLALKEEGYSVVLVNSNPATIMTDKEIGTETRSAQRSILSTAAYRQKSTTQRTQQRRTTSVPKRVGVQGEGLRATEL